MLINRQLPTLVNGVSQQPATIRLPSQMEAVVNCRPSLVEGLGMRPPFLHVARMTTENLSSAFLHTINRDTTERYIVVLTNGNVRVYDLEGNEKAVAQPGRAAWQASTGYGVVGATRRPTTPNGFLYKVVTTGISGSSEPTWPTTLGDTVTDGTAVWKCVPDYLNVTDARTEFTCVSVADYTFVVNKSVTVVMDGDSSIAQPSNLWWLNRNYGSDYVGYDPAFDFFGGIQYQYPPTPSGGTLAGTVQSFEALPETPPNGVIYKVEGTDESLFTSYYVRRNGGVWDETVAPGIQNRIDPTTMPHALVRKADGTFEFGPFSWADRRVGDEQSNPAPTFVGRTIRDVFFYKNRLGFAVDEGAVFSRVGDFGNFFRMTVLQLLDDEVVDIAASETKVTLINHAVPFNNGMMLFSDQTQFRITEGDAGFGPSSAGIKPATQYTAKTDVRPLPLGSDVYFVVENGDFAQIREYYVRDNAVGNDAGDITAHVPKYIPAGVFKLAGSPAHDMLFVLTSGAPSRVYVYNFYWTDGEQKAQSAWHYWQLDSDCEVLSADVLDNDAYFLVKRADGTYIERCPLQFGATAPGLPFQLHLDRRTPVTGTFLSGEGKTEFTLPYPVPEGVRSTFRIVRGNAFTTASGAILSVDPADYEWVNNTTLKVEGNFSAGPCFAGKVFEQRWRFSEVFMRNAQDVPITTGRLMLRTWTLYYINTAYFRTEVAPYGSSPDTVEVVPGSFANFDGKTLGAPSLVLGTPVRATGSYTFGVFGDASVAKVDIVNNTPYGATFQQAEYEGFWHNRGRTV
jgi:hypothetical protein